VSEEDLIQTCPWCDSPAINIERQIIREFLDSRATVSRQQYIDWNCEGCQRNGTASNPFWSDHTIRYPYRDEVIVHE